MVGTGMAAPFPAAAAAAAAAAQFAANGDLSGVKSESGPAAQAQPPLVKSEGQQTQTQLPPNNFSPQPSSQPHTQNSIDNQNNNSVSNKFCIWSNIYFNSIKTLFLNNNFPQWSCLCQYLPVEHTYPRFTRVGVFIGA